MKILLHYIYISSIIACLISCEKELKLTANDLVDESSIEMLDIIISDEKLNQELQKIKTTSSELKLKNKDSVIAFYQIRNGKSAWESAKNRNDLYLAIKMSYTEGLIPNDYDFNKIEKSISAINNEESNNALVDLFLTDTYLTYAYHLANGKIKSQKTYKDWKLDENKFQFNCILNEAINTTEVDNSLENYKPQHKIYKQLKSVLPNAKKRVGTDSLRVIVSHGNKIRPNKSDDRIINIRTRLNQLGFLEDSLVNNSKTLDTLLQESLKKFQLEKNLQVDAIVGEGTVSALNRSYKDDYLSILVNLERWRWFPRDFGNPSIVVNIPQFQLTYTSSDQHITHNIVVGKTARRTPVFSSQIAHIDFNPLWYIPPTIKKEDVIPSATKDVDYLRRKNISVYSRNGKQMQLDSIDWSSNAPYSYSYVQASGDSNALGRLKIIFPNEFSVYLHDTPSKSLFGKNYRAKSSGCVRVQDVFKLAANVLDWQDDIVMKQIDNKVTRRVIPRKKINVHFLYWSVVFNEKSEPIFLNDVYNLDPILGDLLSN